MSQPSIHEMGVGDVAYGIAIQAIEGKWDAEKLGSYIARFAIDYANEKSQEETELINAARSYVESINQAEIQDEPPDYCRLASAVRVYESLGPQSWEQGRCQPEAAERKQENAARAVLLVNGAESVRR